MAVNKGEVAVRIEAPGELVEKFKVLCALSRKTMKDAVVDWMRNPEGLASLKPTVRGEDYTRQSVSVPADLRKAFKKSCSLKDRGMSGEIKAMMQRKVDSFDELYPDLLSQNNWV